MTHFRGLIAASLLLAFSSAAYADAPVVHVSLLGEADQPMSVKLTETEVKSGDVVFQVVNDAIGTDHEVVLVELTSPDQKIDADPKKHRVDEKALNALGEVGGLKPGDKGEMKATLKPGVSYALICNHKSHYELGMATRFTVAK